MTENAWTRWPSREALGREGISQPRRMLGWGVRLLVIGMLLWGPSPETTSAVGPWPGVSPGSS